MSKAALLAVGLSILLSGCATPVTFSAPAITSVVPSATGIPNSVTLFGHYEFVSVQGIGRIFTYSIANGIQTPVGSPYATPCADPSGMVIATIDGNNVMAVACYDTGALLTLTVNANGSLSALGSMNGLPNPYPGIALDGTNVFVPLFGGYSVAGSIAKVSIASPANPVIVTVATLASPQSGGYANPGYLAVAGGYIYAAAGSESLPTSSSSTIQVVNEATMALVGSPLVVAHSPQQIVVQGNVAYVTLFDATALESIDISNPASLQPLQVLSLTAANQGCDAVPVIVQNGAAYVGCYAQGTIDQLDISNPAQMHLTGSVPGVQCPQRIAIMGNLLLETSSVNGGAVYAINLDQF